MSVAKQLYQLQELDLQIDAEEQALKQRTGQLGESEALITSRAKLASGQQGLDELKHQQHAAEWEIDDLTGKIATIDGKLYSGRIRNPKELTDLQHEGNALKAKRSQLETKVLEMMEQVEAAEAGVATESRQFKQLEKEWQSQQQQLAVEIDRLKTGLVDRKQERQQQLGGADPEIIALYEKLKKQKGQALAKIEQGICRGCRLSLSVNEIQQARGGNLVHCSSCGRILYLP